MGYSRLEYVYSGGAQEFAVNFALGYIEPTDVEVYVIGELDGLGAQIMREYTFVNPGLVSVTDPITSGATVVVQRTVDKDQLEIDLENGGAVTRVTLTRAFKQLMMNLHELLDGRIDNFTGSVIDTVEGFSIQAEAAKVAAEAALAAIGTSVADAEAAETAAAASAVLASADRVLAQAAAVAAAASEAGVDADRVAAQAARDAALAAQATATAASSAASASQVAAAVSEAAADADRIAAQAAQVAAAASAAAAATFNPALYMTHNRIINGNFSIWQRGDTVTSTGYGSADRWRFRRSGGSGSLSKVALAAGTALGQNQPVFAARLAVSGQSASSDQLSMHQRIEDVRSYANETITILGWGRRESGAGNVSIGILQSFGVGGSSDVSLPGGIVTLTDTWAPFAVTVAVPSVAGKTITADSYLQIELFASAGADTGRAAGLGIQTINADIWGVHILPGTQAAANALNYRARSEADELDACQRYYYAISGSHAGGIATKYASASGNGWGNNWGTLPVTMRSQPTLTATFDTLDNANRTGVVDSINERAFTIRLNVLALGTYRAYGGLISFDAEL